MCRNSWDNSPVMIKMNNCEQNHVRYKKRWNEITHWEGGCECGTEVRRHKHARPSWPPQITHSKGGYACGTEVRRHKHTWPNRPPPPTAHRGGCARGTEVRRHRHARPSWPPQIAHRSTHRERGCACGTEVRRHKHAWPNRPPPPQIAHRKRLRTWHRSPAPKIRCAKSAPHPNNPQKGLRTWHRSPAPKIRGAKSAPPHTPPGKPTKNKIKNINKLLKMILYAGSNDCRPLLQHTVSYTWYIVAADNNISNIRIIYQQLLKEKKREKKWWTTRRKFQLRTITWPFLQRVLSHVDASNGWHTLS